MMTYSTFSPLFTDLYQLTMAYGYWRLQMHEQEAAFHLIYRKNPFRGEYAIACGLGSVVDYLQAWRFHDNELTYLATLQNSRQARLFPDEFLDYLRHLRFSCHADAIAEGTLVFPHEPLIRIEGPILQCQLLESALLNLVNFQTLIATKASRVCLAAQGDPVIEFGMRRAQGPDGAISASRAAYIGGCEATSNTLAGQLFDIPVRGTHAHSWVTAFDTETDAFAAYAAVMPHNCVLLVDTYDTLHGVQRAIAIGKQLRQVGAELLGIRLDSGDMANLSIKARALLDEAGFQQTAIMASNSLDEYTIAALKEKGACISQWGVGTNLVTAQDQSALDGVYKLSALRNAQGEWVPKLKLSEDAIKISNPGRHQIRRFARADGSIADVIYDVTQGISATPAAVQFDAALSPMMLGDAMDYVDLLEPIFRSGLLVRTSPSIHAIRDYAISNTQAFHQMHGGRAYPVGLEKNLYELKQKLIAKIKAE